MSKKHQFSLNVSDSAGSGGIYGAAIKYLVRQQGLNQREFADRAKLTHDYVSKLVTGKVSEPRLEKKRCIANGLGLTEGELQQQIEEYINSRENEGNATVEIENASNHLNSYNISLNNASSEIICNLPGKNCVKFIGRESQIEKLLKFLSPNTGSVEMGVYGPGGIGKTEFVLDVAYQCLNASLNNLLAIPQFDAIIYISSKTNELEGDKTNKRRGEVSKSLNEIYEVIAKAFGKNLALKLLPERERLDLIVNTLNNQRTFLILDNFETMDGKEAIGDFLQELGSNVKVVVTSREWISYNQIILPKLNQEQSIELIKSLAEEKEVDCLYQKRNTKLFDSDKIDQTYNCTKGLPLAITSFMLLLAGGYTFGNILHEFKEGVKAGHELQIFSYKALVDKLKPLEKQLLMTMTLFETPTTQDHITKAAGLEEQRIEVSKGLVLLQRYSLITKTKACEYYEMAPLLKEYVIGIYNADREFKNSSQERWVDLYLRFIEENCFKRWEFREINSDKYDDVLYEFGNILQMINFCRENPAKWIEDISNAWEFLSDFAFRYGYIIELREAYEWLIKQRNLDERIEILARKNYGYILIRQGGCQNIEDAGKSLLEARKLNDNYKQEGKKIDWKIEADIANHLSIFYSIKEDVKQARDWHKKERSIFNKINNAERITNPEDIQIIKYYPKKLDFDNAEIFYYQTKYQDAEKCYLVAIENKNDIYTSLRYQAYLRLAGICMKFGRLLEAEKYLNLVRGVDEKKDKLLINETSKNVSEKELIAEWQFLYSQLEKEKRRLDSALDWAKKSLVNFSDLKSKRVINVEALIKEVDSLLSE